MSTPYYIILDTDGAFKEALLAAGTGVTLNYDATTRTTTIASIDLAAINSISNPGGNIDLVAGTGISITPDSVGKTITITNTGGAGGGVTSLNTLTGAVTLAAGTNVSLSVVGSTITINATDNFATLNSVTPSANNIDLTGGTNITITPNGAGHTVGVGLSGQVAVANGGTGASTASGALTNLGAPGSLNTATPDPATNSIGLTSSTLTVTNSTHSVAVEIGSNSITDAEIGNRTVNQALATPGNTGLLTSLLSWIAGAIKAAKGTTNWYDTPATDLATANTHITSTSNPHSTTAAQVGAIATVNSITPSGTDFAVTAADSSITIGSATHGITVKANGGGVTSVNSGTGAITVAAGTGIGVGTVGSTITISNTGVDSINGLTGTPSVVAGTGIGVAAAGSSVTVTNSGVTSINSLTGTPSVAAGANISVTPSGSNITVAVSPQGSGSGLDADKVDGIHASGFVQLQSTLSSPTGQAGIVAVGGSSAYPIMQGNNTGAGNGLYGGTTYSGGVAILGESTNVSGTGYGVTGHAVKGYGVRGYTDDSAATGVWAESTVHGAQLHIYPDLGPATVPSDGSYGDGAMYAGLNGVLYYHTRGTFSVLSRGRGTSFPASPQTNERFYRTDWRAEFEWDGSNWQQVSMIYATAFPTSPVSGWHVTRTDLNIEYIWDGNRWKSASARILPFPYQPGYSSPNTTNSAVNGSVSFPNTGYIMAEKLDWSSFINATYDSTHYWTLQLEANYNATLNKVIGSAQSMWQTNRAAATYYPNEYALATPLWNGVANSLQTRLVQSASAPGSIVVNAPVLTYRDVEYAVGLTANFSGSSSATSLGNADSGQDFYPLGASVWGLDGSGKAYCVSDTDRDTVFTESNKKDATITAVISGTWTGTYNAPGIIFRGIDPLNNLVATFISGNITIYKYDVGAFTSLATAAVTLTNGSSYTATITTSGNSISVTINSVTASATLAGADSTKFNASNCTKVGMILSKAGGTQVARWDSLTVA